MIDRFVEIDGTLRRVTFDSERKLAERTGVIWHAVFVDEIDGEPVESPVGITSDTGLTPVNDGHGRAGLAGRPSKVYPALQASPVTINLQASAKGYLPRTLSDLVSAHPDHPADFIPATPAGPVMMQILPVRLEGRVRRRGLSGLDPVAGATVTLAGLWPTLPAAGTIPSADPAEVVEISPPLSSAAANGTAVRRVDLSTPGTDTVLAESAPAGATRIQLASRAGLAPGRLIVLEPTHPDRFEIMRIVAMAPQPPAPFRGSVTLSQPLAFDHPEAVEVSLLTASAVGPTSSLTRDCIPGGVSLFVDNAVGLVISGFVRVGTGAAAQTRRVRAYRAVTDVGGYYRLPPIHRIARGFINASDGTSSVTGIEWTPRRDGPVDRLDLELPL